MNGEHKAGGDFGPLLTAAQAAAFLQISERKLDALRAAGAVPAPIALGPRSLRFVRAELEAHIAALPRVQAMPMPAQLRRARIEAMKAGSGAGA